MYKSYYFSVISHESTILCLSIPVSDVRIVATDYKYYAVIFRCSRIEDDMCLNPEVSIYSRKTSLLKKHMEEAMEYAEDMCIDFRKYVNVFHTKGRYYVLLF